ncbi:Iq-domain 14, putative isoform 3 [Theobroma cacao]|uniref:Iq-domain 14, putative isoform 3 n=1 Tax=Theobroma cacao TaxID=3641 RepID=A0A061FKH3_THECC|nr:Iq-domain 14, putative isoform 3 [Theobroma cacao]
MAKKKSWFNLVKRFFLFETLSTTEKKEKRRKWMFGRFRTKRLASLAAASPPRDKTKIETDEDQEKHALTVAIATAAAAEAAVAAAQVAAEVVRLTGTPQSNHKCEGEAEEYIVNFQPGSSPSADQHERKKIQELAAIKIQATFRGYLARKALRALKGIVMLQAIIRGWAVRRQAMNTLKCLQSIVSIQSQVCARRFEMAEGIWQSDEDKQLLTLKDKIIKSTESEQNKGNGGLKYWLDQWVDTQVSKSKELEDLDSVWNSNPKPAEENRAKQLRLKTFPRQYHMEGLDSPLLVPRRSFHRKQCSLGEDNSFSTSPVVPTYMAATQSAKAKVRSMSSPKLRPGSFDTQSESYSPYKNKLSLISSITRDVPNSCRISSRPSAYQQRSPSLKGVPGPVKSKRTLKDLSFNSECSLPNWVRESTFR